MICWIVRLWSKHRLLAVGCVDRRTQPTAVAYDVDVIPSIVMSLISHVSRYCTTDSLRQIVQVQLAADPFATVRTRLPLTSSIFIAITESHFRFDPVALPISRRKSFRDEWWRRHLHAWTAEVQRMQSPPLPPT